MLWVRAKVSSEQILLPFSGPVAELLKTTTGRLESE